MACGVSALRSVALLCVLGFDVISCDDRLRYGAVSGNVTFSVPNPPKAFTEILWKKGKDKAIEWAENDAVRAYQSFKGRSHLDTTFGNFTISNLTSSDEDMYVVEFSNLKEMFNLKILDPLPSPILNCSVTDGNITVTCMIPENNYTHPHLLRYSWYCHSARCNDSKHSVIYFEKKDHLPWEVWCTVSDPVGKKTSSFILDSCVAEDHSRQRYGIIPAVLLVAISIFLILKGLPESCRNRERTNST